MKQLAKIAPRMSNRAFRPRPIDFSRPMPVVKSQRDLEVNEDGVLVPKKEALEPESLLDMNDVGDEVLFFYLMHVDCFKFC